MDALRTVGDFWEVWIYFLQIDMVLVRWADSWDIDLTHGDKFNVSAHLRIILFFYLRYSLDPGKTISWTVEVINDNATRTVFQFMNHFYHHRFYITPFSVFNSTLSTLSSQVFPNSRRQVALFPWTKIEETTLVIQGWCVVCVFFYGMCWNNENNSLTVYNAEKFEPISKLLKTGTNKEGKHLYFKCWVRFSLKGWSE